MWHAHAMRAHPWIVLGIALAAAACGGKPTPPPTPPPPPPPEPAIAVPWLTGSWSGNVAGQPGTVDVVAQDGVQYGVWLSGGVARVWILDEEVAAEGGEPALQLWSIRGIPGNTEDRVLRGLGQGERVSAFSSADGTSLWTARLDTGGALVIADATTNPPITTDPLARVPAAPAAELEAADRAFAAQVATLGAEGWAAWTATDGVLYRRGAMVRGRDAILAAMTEVFSDGTLVWEPRASRLGPDGTLGFTVGTSTWKGNDGAEARFSYVTIWQRQRDGVWRVWFDTGRPRSPS